MVSLTSLIRLFSFFLTISFVRSIWQIRVLNVDTLKTMERGIFYDIVVFFTDPNPQSFPTVTVKISNEKNIFQTIKETYTIDLSKENRLPTMIGVHCNVELTEATISFVATTEGSFNSIQYPITISATPHPIFSRLTLAISSEILSKGEYGIVHPEILERNVDPLEIKMTSTNALINLEKLIIPSYNPSFLKTKLFAKYSLKSEGTSFEPDISVNLELKTATKCFVLETRSFTIRIGENTLQNTTRQMVGFKINPNAGISFLEISLSKFLAPSMLYCALFSTKQLAPTKASIINQDFYHKDDNSTTRYFKSFLSKKDARVAFFFEGLDKFEQYKLRCVYENSADDPKLKTTSTFSSPNPISIAPLESPQAYCAIWFLKSPKEREDMEKIILNLGTLALISKIPVSEFGCLSYQKRSLEGIVDPQEIPLAMSVCISSQATCSTINTKQDTGGYAEKTMFIFNSSKAIDEAIHQQIGFSKPMIAESFENSASADFEVNNTFHNGKYYNLTFAHRRGIPHDCTVELKCDNPSVASKKESFTLKVNETKTLKLAFTTGDYDDYDYSIYVQCRPMPGLPNHSFLSKFTALQFSHPKNVDCQGKTHLPICYNITYAPPPSFITEQPRAYDEQIVEKFAKMDFNQQQQVLSSLLKDYAKETGENRLLMGTVTLGKMMTLVNCVVSPYNSCRQTKRGISKEMLSLLRKYHPQGKVSDNSTKTLNETITVHRAKLLLMGMHYATSNFDAYANDTSRELLDYTGLLLNGSSGLLLSVNESLRTIQEANYIRNVHSDMINWYISIVDNTINFAEYMQRDQFLISNHSPFGLVNRDEKLLSFKHSIPNLIKGIYEYQPWTTKVNASNFDMTITKVPAVADKTVYDFVVNGTNVTIRFPINYLFVQLGSSFIGVVYYKKSPLIGYNSSRLYSKPIVNVQLFSKSLTPINLKAIEEIPFTFKFALQGEKDKSHFCYFLDNFTLTTVEVVTDIANVQTPACEMTKIFEDLIIGTADLGGKVKFTMDTWIIVLGVLALCVVATIVIYLVVFICHGKKKAENLIEINQQSKSSPLYNDDDMHGVN